MTAVKITREQFRKLTLPQKVRLRWRLRARPKQLTPSPHALCTASREDCEVALSRAFELHPHDEDARLRFLQEAGHFGWFIWLILAGRGWGKTRTGAEDVVKYALEHPGVRIALVAATFSDGRDTMVEGESGILGVLPSRLVLTWNRSIGELILTNGSRMKIFSAEEPERLRGPQHHRAWCDELAAWRYLQDTWDQLMFGLRLGREPQVVVTTTPKPLKFIRKLLERSRRREGGVVVTSGSTFENAANLARAALTELREAYEGTRLGRQELHAEVLDEVEGALWTDAMISADRIEPIRAPSLDELGRVVVAVDPNVSTGEGADECGIVVVAKTRGPCPYCPRANEPHALVLDDRSGPFGPYEWAGRVQRAYRDWKANTIVAEVNNGGDLVVMTMRAKDDTLPVKKVTASRGKATRAEPVAVLYEKHRVHHIGVHEKLEDQMTTWRQDDVTADSPDRMDALVWGLTELMVPERMTRPLGHVRDVRHEGSR